MECFVKEYNLVEAYHKALEELEYKGVIYPCTAYNTEQKEISLTMVVLHPLEEPMISKLFPGGPHELEQYRQEMLDGILDFEIEKGNWPYTYHNRMTNYTVTSLYHNNYAASFNQIEFVIDELTKDPSSRRAVIDIRDNRTDAYSEDPACLQHIQFMIRDNKLNMYVLFRSNDAVKATFMNAFALIQLQARVAASLNIEVGTYTHRANSFHCYKRDYELLSRYVETIKTAKKDSEISYSYTNEWKELMEDEKESISAMITELRERE